jgi:8-oxo-dGTP pyrophosphatase MutT (NUDIX family)
METPRRRLLASLAAYRPAAPGDRERHARLTAFVEAHPDCFSKELAAGHVVASAWVVDRAHRRVLLHHHRRLERWMQFGGHVDESDADVLAAARRELAEEAGLADAPQVGAGIFDLDVHEIPATPKEAAHLHFDVRFAFEANSGGAPPDSPEGLALRWVPLDEVGRVAPEPSLLRMAAKAGLLPPAGPR